MTKVGTGRYMYMYLALFFFFLSFCTVPYLCTESLVYYLTHLEGRVGLRCWSFSFFLSFLMEWNGAVPRLVLGGRYSTGMVRLLSFRLLLHVLADGLHVLENYLALVVG